MAVQQQQRILFSFTRKCQEELIYDDIKLEGKPEALSFMTREEEHQKSVCLLDIATGGSKKRRM